MSLSDMNYVEVYYLNKMTVGGRKWKHYEEKEAEIMYMRTIGKLQSEKKAALICLRTDEHDLIKCELIK